MTSSLFCFPFLQQDLGAWSPWGKFLRDQEQIDQFLYAEIAKCQQKPDPERIDILSLLISSRDEVGQPLTDQELHDQLITFEVHVGEPVVVRYSPIRERLAPSLRDTT